MWVESRKQAHFDTDLSLDFVHSGQCLKRAVLMIEEREGIAKAVMIDWGLRYRLDSGDNLSKQFLR